MERFPENATVEQRESYGNSVKELVESAPKTLAAPVVVRKINDVYEKMFGALQDYTDIKIYYNNLKKLAYLYDKETKK